MRRRREGRVRVPIPIRGGFAWFRGRGGGGGPRAEADPERSVKAAARGVTGAPGIARAGPDPAPGDAATREPE